MSRVLPSASAGLVAFNLLAGAAVTYLAYYGFVGQYFSDEQWLDKVRYYRRTPVPLGHSDPVPGLQQVSQHFSSVFPSSCLNCAPSLVGIDLSYESTGAAHG